MLARQTDGNVFLLVELWQHLVDSELLRRQDGRWSVDRPADRRPQPGGCPRGGRGAPRTARPRRPPPARDGVRARHRPSTPSSSPTPSGHRSPRCCRRSTSPCSRGIVGEYGDRRLPVRPRADPPVGVRRPRQRASGAASHLAAAARARRRVDGARRRDRPAHGRRRAARRRARRGRRGDPGGRHGDRGRRLRRRRPLPRDGADDLAARSEPTSSSASPTPRCAPATSPRRSSAASRRTSWPQRTNDNELRIAAALAYGEAAWRDAREAADRRRAAARRAPARRRRDEPRPAAGVADACARPRRRQRGRARAR